MYLMSRMLTWSRFTSKKKALVKTLVPPLFAMSDKSSWQNSTDPRGSLPIGGKIYIYILYTAYSVHFMLDIFLRNWRPLSLSLSWKCNGLLNNSSSFRSCVHRGSFSMRFSMQQSTSSQTSSLSLFPSVFTSTVITVISTRCAPYSLALVLPLWWWWGRGFD